MPDFIFAYPGDFELPTGGYAYDRRIHAELASLGWSGTLLPLGEGFPAPDPATLAAASARIAAQPGDVPILVDGLAWGVMENCARQVAGSHRIVALVHHPLGNETGLSRDASNRLLEQEKRVLGHDWPIITTSLQTAAFLEQEFDIPGSRITTALPGNDPAKPATGRKDGLIGLIAVGSIIPRKGHDVLVGALDRLRELPWILDIVGDDSLDTACAAQLRKQIEKLGLTDRVTLHGALQTADLNALYMGADIFVLATRYEGYGMAFTEAMMRGLPIVATGHGAVSQTVPSRAGIVCAPEDTDTFRASLQSLIESVDLRRNYRAGALSTAKELPGWQDTAKQIAKVFERI